MFYTPTKTSAYGFKVLL